jgi:hypothetical protein
MKRIRFMQHRELSTIRGSVNHTELLRQHGEELAGILSVLHKQNQALREQSEVSRQQGERLA